MHHACLSAAPPSPADTSLPELHREALQGDAAAWAGQVKLQAQPFSWVPFLSEKMSLREGFPLSELPYPQKSAR